MELTIFDWTSLTAGTIIAVAGAVTALAAVLLTRKGVFESNRPVVTAFVDEESSGVGTTVFNLHVRNSGSRPATEIQLCAPRDVEKLFAAAAADDRREYIKQVVTVEGVIPVLHADEELITSFGVASIQETQAWLEYGEQVRVKLHYRDLEGRKYRSKVLLRLKPRHGFGGGVWRSAS